jgi:pimeloyl-ACP methyl ester carboxylesterase
MRLPLVLAAWSIACAPAQDSDPGTPWVAPAGGVISLTTRDKIRLEADYLPADRAGAPAVVLLHMIPPSNNRTGWPSSFRDALHAEGWSVLSLDRRGAGGSEGVAEDAYLGEKGRWDVEAAALRLQADGFGPLAVIGASNGTTSMLDYAVWAPGEGLPSPVGLAWLSPGPYTEAQTSLDALPPTPSAFLYPPGERAWPESKQALNPGSWTFKSYADGAHGTLMLGTAVGPEVQADLITFVTEAVR